MFICTGFSNHATLITYTITLLAFTNQQTKLKRKEKKEKPSKTPGAKSRILVTSTDPFPTFG